MSNTIHFRGQNYDVPSLVKLVTQGRQQTVPNKDIIETFTKKGYDVRIAYQVDDKYYLLIGSIDAATAETPLRVFSKHVLKKASVETTTYAERQAVAADNRQLPPQGFQYRDTRNGGAPFNPMNWRHQR